MDYKVFDSPLDWETTNIFILIFKTSRNPDFYVSSETEYTGVIAMTEKIGLITFYKDNFGSILQCYATKKAVENEGFECVVLNEPDKELINKNEISKILSRVKFFVSNFISDPSFYIRWKNNCNIPDPLSKISKDLMDEFVDEVIRPEICTMEQFDYKVKSYKAFIVGSDQIWNAYNDISPLYFLKFAPDSKKIAFSVSFGTDNISNSFLRIIKDGVKGFKRISVREESGLEIIKKCSDAEVVRVGDPTLLLSADEWRDFCIDASIEPKPYILVHFLNYPSILALSFIDAHKNDMLIVCIAYHYNINKEMGWKFVDCNPAEYVAYIDRAAMIFTDSFHTTLFSIYFGKEFFTFERQYLHGHPQTSRINDLLKRYRLEDRFIRSEVNKYASNISSASEILKNERKLTADYLINEIKNADE